MESLKTCFASFAVLSVKKVNFQHMGRTHFPSKAAVASEFWSRFGDYVEIASLDLMENMDFGGASHIILLSFKKLDQLMKERDGGNDVIKEEFDEKIQKVVDQVETKASKETVNELISTRLKYTPKLK